MPLLSGVGILLASMGLFGMATLSVARRTKEMGILKVLGATQGSILTMFQREILGIFYWPLCLHGLWHIMRRNSRCRILRTRPR